MLLVRPRPQHGESRHGLLLRVSSANALGSPGWMALKWLDSLLAAVPGAPARGPVVGYPHLACPDAGGLPARYWNTGRPRYCPCCLGEQGVWRSLWELVFYTDCDIHGVELRDRCAACKKPLKWKRRELLHCDCGANGSLQYIIDAAGHTKASAVILLGDIEPVGPLHLVLGCLLERTWWIPGNHDSDSDEMWRRVATPEMAERNLHGRVLTMPDGTRVAGLGGVFREVVWYPDPAAARGGAPAFRSRQEHASATPRQDRWEGGHHRKHWGTIYPDEVDRLAELQADVLVTHEAPAYHPNGFDILDTLAQAMGAKLAVHGHHHDRLDSTCRHGEQGFKSFGVGLRGISAIDMNGTATLIRPGELDEVRRHRR